MSWLLGDLDITHFLDPDYRRMENNSSVVLSGQLPGEEQKIHDYICRFRDNGLPVGIIHLSDEWHKAPVSFYPAANFVFRNYYRPKVMRGTNCHYFPLGYRAGFTSKLVVKDIRDRLYSWSFAGALKASRRIMLDSARRIPDGKHHLTDGWLATIKVKGMIVVDQMGPTIQRQAFSRWGLMNILSCSLTLSLLFAHVAITRSIVSGCMKRWRLAVFPLWRI